MSKPDEILALIVGPEPRPEGKLLKALWDYVKQNNLKAGSGVKTDAKLKSLTGGKEEVGIIELNKFFREHVLASEPNPNPTTPEEILTEQFRAFNVKDPEAWASSQINEGIPQYARMVFLKAAWKTVIRKHDWSWLDEVISGDSGPALERILSAGISRQDLVDVIRAMQNRTLFQLCYLLGDPSIADYPTEAHPRVYWRLTQLDENGTPTGYIDGLNENVLALDPTSE